MNELFFVSCTRGRKEETALYRSLRKLGTDRFQFFENNQKGLPTCYNSVLDERGSRDDIVIFVHDDVTIGDLFIREKLTAGFDHNDYAIAGLAGNPIFTINSRAKITPWWTPPQECHSGAVEHCGSDSSPIMAVFGPTPRRCVVLDGLFLAVDLKKARHLRFDEQFDFHFYDLDFCLTAHQAGLVLGTVNVYVTHHKLEGDYVSQAFKDAQTKFRAKWKSGQYRADLPVAWQEALRELPLCLPQSAWTGHISFMFLLFKLAEPRTYVELGVDLGASFLAACEAARRFHIGTRCFGIDTWVGDEHAGFRIGDAIFGPLQEFVAARYPSCALRRLTFDQAVTQFEDKSIDVLHIDGLHTYDAVSHDFATWQAKLSDRSIVLFHDTEVKERGFGVYKFWSELKTRYRHIEFKHSSGLGVLVTGTSVPREVDLLVEFISANAEQAAALQDICKAAGDAIQHRTLERGPPMIGESALIKNLVTHYKPDVRLSPAKPRRNDLCYCGSGRKYKHCHGQIA